MLETVLKVLTEGERRWWLAGGGGWLSCMGEGDMGRTLDEVVRLRECA